MIALGFAGASCATVSGLADYGVVDCPGGCPDVGADAAPDVVTTTDGAGPGTDSGTTDAPVDSGPAACDPAKDANCIQLPPGFTLVARYAIAAADNPPACPAGMTTKSLVVETANAMANSCTCDCSVTAPASCNGDVSYAFGSTACTVPGDPSSYKNAVVNTCMNNLYTGVRSAMVNKFTLPSPSGGSCAAAATPHFERVQYTSGSELCDDTSRCSGGVCEGAIDAPFQTCVAKDGDVACPAGFGDKHLLGGSMIFDCSPTCGCNVVRGTCTGSVNHYSDANCMVGQVAIPANGTCGGPNTDGDKFLSYKVVATSATTCDPGGSAAASNVRVKDPRTVCCR